MSLIKKPSGSLGQKLVFSGSDIIGSISSLVAGMNKTIMILTMDTSKYNNLSFDSDYFTLDSAKNAYKCSRDFSFKLSVAGNLKSTVNLSQKPNVSFSFEDGLTMPHFDREVGNINPTTSNTLYYWNNQGYIFQAVKDSFIGFSFFSSTATTLSFQNLIFGVNDFIASVQIIAVD